MKIVIDISKDRYDEIMSMDWKNCRRFFDEEIRAIHDGKALEQEPCDAVSRKDAIDACLKGLNRKEMVLNIKALPPVTPAEKVGRWIPVSERLPELNKPLLVTAYHRVCYAHMISESGNYGYPVFRLHEIKDSDRGWVQETISHEPYSMGRIDAWMYIDIPEPYKASPTGAESEG